MVLIPPYITNQAPPQPTQPVGTVPKSCTSLRYSQVSDILLSNRVLLLVGILFVWGITEDPMLIGSTHDPGATTTYK